MENEPTKEEKEAFMRDAKKRMDALRERTMPVIAHLVRHGTLPDGTPPHRIAIKAHSFDRNADHEDGNTGKN